MMQSLRNIKLRIRRIESTQRITRAMEMVSSSKLNRTRGSLFSTQPYFMKLESILRDLIAHTEASSHPLLEKRKKVEKLALCIISSDAGLCSVYNYAIIRLVEEFIKKHGADRIRLIAVGREGANHFERHGIPVSARYTELYGRYSDNVTEKITKDLTALFAQKEVDEVYIAYTHFEGTLRHRPTIEKFLNVEAEATFGARYIIEPNAIEVLDELIPKYLFEKLRLILLNAFTAEHAARMIAMKMATDNADELVDTLTLLRNRVRQATITKDILEIAMTAEALKE